MRVIFHYDAGPALARRLSEASGDGLDISVCPAADDARFRELMTDADVLWHVLRPLSATDIAAAPGLRLIQKIGVGVNTIDLDAARTRDIPVCNMPGTNTRAVAEMTLALMLAALRRLSAFDRATREGAGWKLDSAMQDCLGEIGGRVVGLVGYGAVPQALAPVLKALGARLLYTARAPRREAEGLAEWRTLPVLLEESDIVSLHLPETAETVGMIDAAALARMKPGAVLVNTARGSLVDEAALAVALASGRLAAAGLDVFAREPVAPGNPLLGLDNAVLAPHVAWLTMDTIERSLDVALDNCRRLVAGEPLRFRVA
ncbi:MAG: 2-hydroxyacid dehydrogenase [Defluviicoccus sp.]|nr:2-hydroxyacid dehydrogenase [Defluviicoccus sp.]MDE0382340.1 2-hydroxyacid dehydrogenase [Defluviicoccus sp.]